MAISPRFAAVSTGDPLLPHDSPNCFYSFDLDGNVLEMNGAMAGILGYTREAVARMNLGQLLEPESWKDSREQILVQLGGGGPQWVNLIALARDGRHVHLAVVRRLLFERGRPVAIQDAGRVLSDSGESALPAPASEDTGARKTSDPNGFAEQLKQLHRLSTTSYLTLEQALEDHLETGCRLFHLPVGTLLQVESDNGVVQASRGRAERKDSILIPLWQTRAYTVTSRLRTLTASVPGLAGSPSAEFETYIGTPVWLGSELFATLSFSGPFGDASRIFSHSDRELIELMARSIGRVVLEHRIQSERDRLQSLERNRNRVLEMVAENESIAIILEEVVHLVEAQCPGALCSLLLLKDEMLAWVAAPGFPAEALRLLKPFRVLRDTAGLAAAEV
ncbi:MAG TPA: PAS domain S-box protein, partial [Bryobacteraceae bacterium]|nr:PAS domain S-box protein [Bryobacteraceae bacterium]